VSVQKEQQQLRVFRHINANTHNQPKRAAIFKMRLYDVDDNYRSLLYKRERS